MGERQSGPLGLHLQLDSGLLRSFRTTGGFQRLVLPNPLGSPSWLSSGGAAHAEAAKAKPGLPAFVRPKVSTAGLRDLSAAEEGMLKRVYDRQVKSRGGLKNAIMGLPEEQLSPVDTGQKKLPFFASHVAPKFEQMWKAMVAAREDAATGIEVGVASAYRDATSDEFAWQKSVRKYLNRTQNARQATGDPFGNQALLILLKEANRGKAPAGFSGHTHGIAADLFTVEKGRRWEVNSDHDHQVGWQKTWLYGWLVENAGDYGFFQLKTETWHWEYHEGKPSRSCYAGDAPISARPVPPPPRKS